MAAPQLASIADQTLLSGAPLYVPLIATDPDGDLGGFSVTVVESSLSHPQITHPVLLPIIEPSNRNLRLTVRDYGDMVFELFENFAPRTTGRIVELVQQGFYNGLTFHRIVPNFVIQGGDPTGTGMGGSGLQFDDEFHPYLMHTGAGVLSMAKSADDTNDSQFFITLGASRHLDFNHSVFGFLVRGSEVLQQVATVSVDQNARPTTPVVIESASIFSDPSFRTLVLVAPWGTTGSAVVKVSVRDSQGDVAEQTFRVNVIQDPYNLNAFLLPILPIWTQADTPVDVLVAAYDREESSLKFAAAPASGVTDIRVQIDPIDQTTARLSVSPQPGAVGVRSLVVGVSDPSAFTSDPWDIQVVPVYIRPGRPSVQLLPEADTGTSSSDGITRLNNTPNARLKFSVTGLVTGAEVHVLVDGVVVASGVATGPSLVLESTGAFPLADGPHTITAVQVLRDVPVNVGNFRDSVNLWSDNSTAVSFVVDSIPPVIISSPVTTAAEGRMYEYQVEVNPEVNGPITFELVSGPTGLTVDRDTGRVRWMPDFDQAGLHYVTIRAIDAAGNESEQMFSVTVANAPEFLIADRYELPELIPWELGIRVVGENPSVHVEVISALPEGMTFDSDGLRLRWTPSEAQGPGLYQLRLRAVDAAGIARETTLHLQVHEQNQPPQLIVVDEIFAQEGEELEIVPRAVDDDLPAQSLVFNLEGPDLPGLVFDPAAGIIKWQPPEAAGPGEYRLKLRVTDSFGASNEKEICIKVQEVHQPPAWQEQGPFQAVVGDRFLARVKAVDPDIPASEIRYRLLEGPPGLSLDTLTGELEWHITRQTWQAMGMPANVFVRIDAYKAPGDDNQVYSTGALVEIQLVDPWLVAMAAWGLSEAEAAGPETPAEPLPVETDRPDSAAWQDSQPRSSEDAGWLDVRPSPSLFAGSTGWLTRPTGALGLSQEFLDIIEQLEQEFLKRHLPEELRGSEDNPSQSEDAPSLPTRSRTTERSQAAGPAGRRATDQGEEKAGDTGLAEQGTEGTTPENLSHHGRPARATTPGTAATEA